MAFLSENLSLVMCAAFLGGVVSFYSRRPRLACGFMSVGLFANLWLFIGRYTAALPFMPLHIGLIGISLLLACVQVFFRNKEKSTPLPLLLLLLALCNLLYPKDFYLPFIRSQSLFAHAFLLFGIGAKALLILAAVSAVGIFLRGEAVVLSAATRLVSFGYFLLILSMFTGEIWSYLGWGTPVVWHDAAITTVIALWFYWSCFLHLHYIRAWSTRWQGAFLAAGGVLTFLVSVLPDLGPYQGVL